MTFLLILYLLSIHKDTIIFDFSGAEAFIKLVTRSEIKPEDIESLFTLESYAKWLKYSKEYYWGVGKEEWKNILLCALKPEKYKLPENYKKAYILKPFKHIERIKEKKEKVRRIIYSLKESLMSDSLISMVKEYLPMENFPHEFTVYFLIGPAQGFPINESEVIVDIMDGDYYKFLSHEIFHLYREYFLKIYFKKDVEVKKDYLGIFYALNWLENEGIATRLSFYRENIDSIFEKFKREKKLSLWNTPYVNHKEYLRKLEVAFEEILNGNVRDSRERIDEILRPEGGFGIGHSLGHVIAMVIEKVFGVDSLKKCVGKPYEFIIMYNKAAKRTKDKFHVFKDDILNKIKKLYIPYLKNRNSYFPN